MKLRLTLLTIVVLLGIASSAQADQSAGPNTQSATAVTGSVEQATATATGSQASVHADPGDQATATATGSQASVPADPGDQATATATGSHASVPADPGGPPVPTNAGDGATPTSTTTGPANTTGAANAGGPTDAPGNADSATQSVAPAGPADTTGNADSATQTVGPAGPADTTGNAGAGQQATSQTVGQQGAEAITGNQDPGPAESNTTSQTIWQVQISGCIAHCQGTSQTQTANQQNTTVQVVEAPPEVATGPGTLTGPERPSQPSTSVTQIQLGCLQFCFGTTTGAATPDSGEQAIEQLLHLLARPGLPPQEATPATLRNIVDQTAYQWQQGRGMAVLQTQSASQGISTIQGIALSASLTAALQAALVSSGSPAGEAVNQTEQGIWQLQIGCIFYCIQTTQYQQAGQSSTTIQVLLPRPDSSTQTTAAAVNTVTQVVWQLQIGCLFWCFDATEQQTAATSQNTLVEIPNPAPADRSPPETSLKPPDPGNQQAPSAAQPASSTPSGGAVQPGSTSHTGTPSSPGGAAGTSSGSAQPIPSDATTATSGSTAPPDRSSAAGATPTSPTLPAVGGGAPSSASLSTETSGTVPSTATLGVTPPTSALHVTRPLSTVHVTRPISTLSVSPTATLHGARPTATTGAARAAITGASRANDEAVLAGLASLAPSTDQRDQFVPPGSSGSQGQSRLAPLSNFVEVGGFPPVSTPPSIRPVTAAASGGLEISVLAIAALAATALCVLQFSSRRGRV